MTTSVTTFKNVSRDILRDSVTNSGFHVRNLSRDSVTPRVTDKGVYLYTPSCHTTVTPRGSQSLRSYTPRPSATYEIFLYGLEGFSKTLEKIHSTRAC